MELVTLKKPKNLRDPVKGDIIDFLQWCGSYQGSEMQIFTPESLNTA
jgi:hypothetical protein